ncbi:MAG TPA: hypothetical protein VGX48_19670 [Pyrinomonadaceae bacterium]|jgi:hypothetical protein|nr:hypothetical protein [Pyrinomonadaceae bacterium]
MKPGKLALLLLFLLPASAGAQEPTPRLMTVPPKCPVIKVSCLDSVKEPGASITFEAKLEGVDPSDTPTFNWTVSAGAITAGQSTPTITVDTTGVAGGSVVTATVELRGIDRSCYDTTSCSTVVFQPPIVERFDFYGNIRFEDEQARLDNFAIEVENDPRFNAYIVCYGGRRGYRGEARARCERAKRYLVGRRQIPPERIVLADGGFMEELQVWLWLLLPGTDVTRFTPRPTVAPGEVQFIGKPSVKRGARRRAH